MVLAACMLSAGAVTGSHVARSQTTTSPEPGHHAIILPMFDPMLNTAWDRRFLGPKSNIAPGKITSISAKSGQYIDENVVDEARGPQAVKVIAVHFAKRECARARPNDRGARHSRC
jgi:hypothetical protein